MAMFKFPKCNSQQTRWSLKIDPHGVPMMIYLEGYVQRRPPFQLAPGVKQPDCSMALSENRLPLTPLVNHGLSASFSHDEKVTNGHYMGIPHFLTQMISIQHLQELKLLPEHLERLKGHLGETVKPWNPLWLGKIYGFMGIFHGVPWGINEDFTIKWGHSMDFW